MAFSQGLANWLSSYRPRFCQLQAHSILTLDNSSIWLTKTFKPHKYNQIPQTNSLQHK